MTTRVSRWRATSASALTVALLSTAAVPAGAGDSYEELASGFVGPLGLALGDDGTTYVAEAFAGTLTSIDKHGTRRVLHQIDGFLAGVAAQGRGGVVFTEVLDAEPYAPPLDTRLSSITPAGKPTVLTSLQDYEEEVNPDGHQEYGLLDADEECLASVPEFVHPYPGIVESNPYAVAIDGGSFLVADAAGNSILRVSSNGKRMSTVAVLPPVLMEITEDIVEQFEDDFDLSACVGGIYHAEAVPTDIEVGPDGHYYVSTLPGEPAAPGTASVWRIDRRSGALTEVVTGLNGAVDLAVARDGTIYVAELFGNRIAQVRNGTTSTLVEVPLPGAVEVFRDGTVYATTGTFFEDGGSLIRIRP